MKVTKKLLLEIIESELSLLTEANETDALRGYFSLGTDVELKIKDSGRIVTALQDFLINRSKEGALSAVDSIKSAIEAMGDPDGNIGPKTVAAIKAFQGHFGEDETGVYNSAVHNAIAGPAPAVEAAAEESAEETADFPHPKWDALLEESPELVGALSKLSADDAKALLSRISEDKEGSFRKNLFEFLVKFRTDGTLTYEPRTLHRGMRIAIATKLLTIENGVPAWIFSENVATDFDNIVEEKHSDENFRVLNPLSPEELLSQQGQSDEAEAMDIQKLKNDFSSKFFETGGKYVPDVGFGKVGATINSIQELGIVYVAINEIIEKWDVVTRAEEAEETEEPLTESRLQKLAGI